MTTFEIIISLIASGILSALLALFYRFGRNQERMENSFKTIDDKLTTIDTRLYNVEKDLQQLNTKVAVIESRLTDVTTNVSHLMWHSQAITPKDANEQ